MNKMSVVEDGLLTSHWASLGEVHPTSMGKLLLSESSRLKLRAAAHRHAFVDERCQKIHPDIEEFL